MQAYDLIMLIVLGMATIFGAIKGFAWQVASLASIIVSYIVSYRFRFQVAEMIEAKPPWNQFLAMLILYVGTSFVIWVGFRLLSGAIDKVRLKEFDRHMGAAFGLAKGVIFCLLITMFAMSLLGPNQQAAICQSRSGYYIASALDRGVGILPKEIHDVVGPYLASLDSKLKNGQQGLPQSNESGFGFPAGLEQFQQGLPNMQDAIADALPGLALPGLNNQLNSQSGTQGNGPWNQSNSGIAFPTTDGNSAFGNSEFGNSLGQPGTFPPQNFPPLNSAPQFNPNGAAQGLNFNPSGGTSGLRPMNGGQVGGGQAQQPGLVLPR